nr:alpha/beta fold hydrolase [Saccharopolyspora elongata]
MGALSGRLGRALAIATSALVTGTVVVAGSPAMAQPPGAAPVAWGECDSEALDGVPITERYLYRCASYPVPIDHDDPRKGTVELAMMRRAAADPDAKIGSLFLNPGGPGGAGFNRPVTAVKKFEPQVLNRFDIIGFDPRGVDRSTRLRCFETAEQAEEVLGRLSSVPVTDKQIRTTMAAFRDYGEACDDNAGELLHHMSTKDVARDLDRCARAWATSSSTTSASPTARCWARPT